MNIAIVTTLTLKESDIDDHKFSWASKNKINAPIGGKIDMVK